MLDGSWFFECQCGSDEHTLRFTLDEKEKEIYTSVYLNCWRPWHKRIWLAVKYIFRYTCKYGHFDCYLMKNEDVKRMREMLDDFDRMERYKKGDIVKLKEYGLVEILGIYENNKYSIHVKCFNEAKTLTKEQFEELLDG